MSKRQALAEKKARKKESEDEEIESEEEQEESDSEKPVKEVGKDGEEYWSLTKNKRLSVGSFKGKTNISLREYF